MDARSLRFASAVVLTLRGLLRPATSFDNGTFTVI
jgi:hypothetical protein